MKVKVCLGACALLVSSFVFAQQTPDDQKAAMDAMMKAATPGDAHKKLASFAGTWDATVKTFMAPGAPPSVSHATATNKSILGGRYLQQDVNGDFMGMPFNGVGVFGYDNVKKQYIATWMDNMGTGVMTLTGTMDSPTQYTFKGAATDPMSGKDTPFEEHWIIPDNDHQTLEMFGAAPDGKMVKMMEINYTRKKS
jgi:hypothetical protein